MSMRKLNRSPENKLLQNGMFTPGSIFIPIPIPILIPITTHILTMVIVSIPALISVTGGNEGFHIF